MDKRELLNHLAIQRNAIPADVAAALDVTEAAAAMALLRLVRQGLAYRLLGSDHRTYCYNLSASGFTRRAYFRTNRTYA
jgi:hypothetical protein